MKHSLKYYNLILSMHEVFPLYSIITSGGRQCLRCCLQVKGRIRDERKEVLVHTVLEVNDIVFN